MDDIWGGGVEGGCGCRFGGGEEGDEEEEKEEEEEEEEEEAEDEERLCACVFLERLYSIKFGMYYMIIKS